jgi:hypothetical protein
MDMDQDADIFQNPGRQKSLTDKKKRIKKFMS